MISFFLLGFACTPVASDVDWSSKTIDVLEDESFDVVALQSSLEWFFTELSSIRVSELLKIEAELREMDALCPETFEGVSDATAWNNICSSQYGIAFDGRSQSMYKEEQDWEGVYYSQVASYISAYTIESEMDGWSLHVNGYGDIRRNESENWMEVVGTYAAEGVDLPWPSAAQSVAVYFERGDNDLSIEGGISHSQLYAEPVVSIRATECTLTEFELACTIIAQSSQGAQRSLLLAGSLTDCIETEDGDVCWDVRELWGMTW